MIKLIGNQWERKKRSKCRENKSALADNNGVLCNIRDIYAVS